MEPARGPARGLQALEPHHPQTCGRLESTIRSVSSASAKALFRRQPVAPGVTAALGHAEVKARELNRQVGLLPAPVKTKVLTGSSRCLANGGTAFSSRSRSMRSLLILSGGAVFSPSGVVSPRARRCQPRPAEPRGHRQLDRIDFAAHLRNRQPLERMSSTVLTLNSGEVKPVALSSSHTNILSERSPHVDIHQTGPMPDPYGTFAALLWEPWPSPLPGLLRRDPPHRECRDVPVAPCAEGHPPMVPEEVRTRVPTLD